MNNYWFVQWMTEEGVSGQESLTSALRSRRDIDRLLKLAPEPVAFVRDSPSGEIELTGGRGIDLTGNLGCHHIDCLSKDIDGLFRHTWHYFDRVSLPDQAHTELMYFQRGGATEDLVRRLATFTEVLARLREIDALELVRFDVRMPPCTEHLADHAREAGIATAVERAAMLSSRVAEKAQITWHETTVKRHLHLEYRLEDAAFAHTQWGTLCAEEQAVPRDSAERRLAIARDVVDRYLAALSADALAAAGAKNPLGTTVPFFRQLLGATELAHESAVAFELDLPVAREASTASLIQLRRDEPEAFARFQLSLRRAIAERVRAGGSSIPSAIALEIRRDIIDPELGRIRTALSSSRAFALRGAATGIGLGTIVATVGLLAFPASSIGAGLAVGGAVTLGAQALKKANDDHLAALRDVRLADLYFLWRAHQH